MMIKKYEIVILMTYMSFFLNVQGQNSSVINKLDLNTPILSKVNQFKVNGNQPEALKELLKIYQQKENIYFKISLKDREYVLQKYPEEVENTIEIANQVVKKYFLFREEWDMEKTNIPYRFKKEIDWGIIPFGDPEWTWMLNRHKYWTHLAKAYFFTGEEKYAKCFIEQATHWIDNNTLSSLKDEHRSSGAWRSIEAGIRCENWIKSFELIKNSKHMSTAFLEKFLNSLYQHGEYINNNYSNFSRTSNWGVLENHGLFNLSVFLKPFKISPEWQKIAINRLADCIKLQILNDGSQWEQSPMYHNEVFHCFLNVNLLAQRNQIKLPEDVIKKTKDMAYANIKWQKPNYHQPLLGDSDDTDLRGLLTTAAFIFNDSVIKSRAYENLDYENFLLLGMQNVEPYKKIVLKNPDFLSIYQQSSGDFYMRTSWEEDATYTGFHLRKLGCGHGHDNLLHFTLFANGQDYLIDGGRYTYVNNSWREFFKNNKSHNTLGVDNLTNSVFNDSWTNTYEAQSQGIFTLSTNNFDYAEAENIAYKRLEDPVSMKRRLLFLKPNVWLIFDSFSANKEHRYSQYFNFPNDKIEIRDNGLSTTYRNNNLRIQPINNTELSIEDSWWSPEYNLKLQNKRAEIFNTRTGFHSFITLIYLPEQTKIDYKKIPVFSRNNIQLSDSEVEAISFIINGNEYIMSVIHNASSPANQFYLVDDIFIQGEVNLIEKGHDEIKIIRIKE